MRAKIFNDFNKDVEDLLIQGKVGIIPTDTVYGIVASAKMEDSVSKIYSLKKRENKPGTVIASSIEQIVELGIKKRYLKAVEDIWQNEVSIIIPVGDELSYIHLGFKSIAFRIVKDTRLINLLNSTGPLVTSSANLTTKPIANTIQEAIKYFNDEVEFYVDGGDLSFKLPSTIIKIVDDEIVVIRDGSFKLKY